MSLAALSRPPLSPQLGDITVGEYQRCTAVCWLSCLGGVLVPAPLPMGRNRYLCLLSGHVEPSQPCLQGLGGGPWPIILSSPFCLSHKAIYTTRFFHWACFTYTHTGCIFLPLCLSLSEDNVRCALRYALDSMQRDLWCTQAQQFCIAVFKKTVYFYYLFSALLSQW